MQRQFKRRLFRAALLIILFCLLSCISLHPIASAGERSSGKAAANIELTIDYGNSTQQVFPNLSGDTVFDILNQTATVVFTQYAYGKFITSINGVDNNEGENGRYWQYWVNDELAPVAADNYVLVESDQVLWKYCAPETTPATP
ncbi:MAG: DUF4430 domain-containing protein, partial [Candidatus Hermodarchaeota archaeon]|nr:DUF4430 domain-containing protein [Candidatus Hermodarchaeota archaeon]